MTPLETEMLAALKAVLSAYKDYGSRALRSTEEYKSLTLVRRAIKHAKNHQQTPILPPFARRATKSCGKSYVFEGGASGGDMSVPCRLSANHEGVCEPPRVVGEEYSWQCNNCGSDEFSSSVSEDDLESLSCTGCGGDEFHKVWDSGFHAGTIR